MQYSTMILDLPVVGILRVFREIPPRNKVRMMAFVGACLYIVLGSDRDSEVHRSWIGLSWREGKLDIFGGTVMSQGKRE